MDLRIYLLGGDPEEYGDQLPDDFSDIQSTVVQVEPEDPLATAPVELSLALEKKITSAHWYFVYPPDDEGRIRQADHPAAFVDAAGEIIWSSWRYENVTFGDLQRAARFALFEGDPAAVVLDARPYGDGAPLDWAEFFGWLTSFATAAAAYAGTKEAIKDLSAAAFAVARILRSSYRWLIKRGGTDPRTPLSTILSKEAWRAETLSGLLRLSVEEAKTLLEALGYVRVVEDLYRRESVPSPSLRELLIEEHLGGDPVEFRWRHKRNRL